MKTARDIILSAKALIPDEAHWSTDPYRVEGAQADGYGSPTRDTFCAVGALASASGGDRPSVGRLGPGSVPSDACGAFLDAVAALHAAIGSPEGYDPVQIIEDWNDRFATFDSLHAAFDKAAEDLS